MHHPSAWWCSPLMWPPLFTTNWTRCDGRCLKCLNILYTAQAYHYVICTSLDQPSKATCSCRTMMCRMLWYSNLQSRPRNSLQRAYANLCVINGTLSKCLCWHFHHAYSQSLVVRASYQIFTVGFILKILLYVESKKRVVLNFIQYIHSFLAYFCIVFCTDLSCCLVDSDF